MRSPDKTAQRIIARKVTVISNTLLLIAALTAVVFAADILIPVALAALLTMLLSPIVCRLVRLGVPAPLASVGVLACTLLTVLVTILALSDPAERWISEAPRSVEDFRSLLDQERSELDSLSKFAAEVDQIATGEVPSDTQKVVVQAPGMIEVMLGSLPSFLSSVAIVSILTLFALGSNYEWRRRLLMIGDDIASRRRIYRIATTIQNRLSTYLLTVALINASLGVVVAAAMMALGVPNPMLWGAMVALFNFAPYVGPIASAGILFVVGFATFDDLTRALTVPGIFGLITFLEGQVMTPTILGRHLSISPIIVFLSVVVWGWLWGIVGALIAVPLMMTLRVVADHVPSLTWLSVALSATAPRRRYVSDHPKVARQLPQMAGQGAKRTS